MRASARRDSDADNDRTTLQSWHEWEVRDGERRIILCVSTPLELRPGFPGYDAMRLEALNSRRNGHDAHQCQSDRRNTDRAREGLRPNDHASLLRQRLSSYPRSASQL